ncbi:hypothetical protein SGP15004_21780 [Shigella flexneri]|nr:hypothetical protein SGP12012_30000 [Shigella flexneri]GLG13283.1 hypothetical protein SGP12048_25540 [Shigella flexneri]GLG17735.1 hypothetical protein SGP12049_25450 [Shigella flexneri]GLG22328.1 hypothetical protein SGP14013_27150 [Shigella flexneri]GLG26624.1 hypothetical protein SGP14014_24690 [Shigella flexneri]
MLYEDSGAMLIAIIILMREGRSWIRRYWTGVIAVIPAKRSMSISTLRYVSILAIAYVATASYLISNESRVDWPPESPDNQYHLFK